MIKDGLKETGEINSFLMIGQSNMCGRGDIGDVEEIVNENCFMLRMGRWQPMSEPINADRAIKGIEFASGVCLATSFADELNKKTGKKIGLIPCADGGTKLSQWMPGELNYDHAVYMSNLAMRTSEIKAILWHQGESDCDCDENVDTYKKRFIKMITALRKELKNESLPVIIGELCENMGERWNMKDRPLKLNKVFYEIEKELPFCKVVSAKELELKRDGIHFNSESLRAFGKRYFEKYMEFIKE